MKKKLMLPLIVAALGLSACSSEPAAAPLEAEPLHNLLIDGSESGLDNATEGNDTSLSGQPINLTVVNGALDIDGSCGKALQAVEYVNLDSVASASRALASGDKQVGIAMYSTAEDNDISPMDLYADIANACEDPVVDSSDTTYTFGKLDDAPDGAVGFTLDIEVTPDNQGSTVMMIQELGNHHIIVAGLETTPEETATVFEAQRTKLEEGLAA